MDSALAQFDGLAARVDTVKAQLLAPLDTLEASLEKANPFAQVVDGARTRVGSVLDGFDAQVRKALAG
jgi:ABC-type transporter Mla subunit MlaD